ncbi:MAG: hypothetical protein U0414_02190 [Polyangiaceae bacterium]
MSLLVGPAIFALIGCSSPSSSSDSASTPPRSSASATAAPSRFSGFFADPSPVADALKGAGAKVKLLRLTVQDDYADALFTVDNGTLVGCVITPTEPTCAPAPAAEPGPYEERLYPLADVKFGEIPARANRGLGPEPQQFVYQLVLERTNNAKTYVVHGRTRDGKFRF